jgi:transcriptional regulator with XRE-family HTH domain
MHVGDEVRRRREEQGLTGTQLAEKAGMAPSAISQIETGRRSPHSTSVIKLAEALGCEVGDLYPKKVQSPLWSDDASTKLDGGIDRWAQTYAELGEEIARRAANKLEFFAGADRDWFERHFGPLAERAATVMWMGFEPWFSEFSEDVLTFSHKALETQEAAHHAGEDPQVELIGNVCNKLFSLCGEASEVGKKIARAAFEEDQDAERYKQRFREIVEADLRTAQSKENYERVLQQR